MARKKRGGYHSNTDDTSNSTYESDDSRYFDDSDDSYSLYDRSDSDDFDKG